MSQPCSVAMLYIVVLVMALVNWKLPELINSALKLVKFSPWENQQEWDFQVHSWESHLHFVSLTSGMMERMGAMGMEQHSEPFWPQLVAILIIPEQIPLWFIHASNYYELLSFILHHTVFLQVWCHHTWCQFVILTNTYSSVNYQCVKTIFPMVLSVHLVPVSMCSVSSMNLFLFHKNGIVLDQVVLCTTLFGRTFIESKIHGAENCLMDICTRIVLLV